MTNQTNPLDQQWLVGCTSKQLGKRPVAVCVLNTPLVLFRSGNTVVAAEDRCPHRNAPLSQGFVSQGRITCPYHGWSFDTQGRCVDVPGVCSVPSRRLNRWPTQESDGLIWVAPPDTPAERSFYRPQVVNDSGYRGFTMTADLEADIADALENLLDGTHTPYVHSGLVRSTAKKQELTATLRQRDGLVEVEYRGESGQSGLISRLFERDRKVSFGRYIPPCTAELEYRSSRRIELLVVAHFTPSLTRKIQVFVTCYVPNGFLPAAVRFAIVKPFFNRVLKQDAKILNLQSQNILRFGGPNYTHWTADLLRPWIDAWLRDGELKSQVDSEHEVRFLL